MNPDEELRKLLTEIEKAASELEGHARHWRQRAERRGRRLDWYAANKPRATTAAEPEVAEFRAALERLRDAYKTTQRELEVAR